MHCPFAEDKVGCVIVAHDVDRFSDGEGMVKGLKVKRAVIDIEDKEAIGINNAFSLSIKIDERPLFRDAENSGLRLCFFKPLKSCYLLGSEALVNFFLGKGERGDKRSEEKPKKKDDQDGWLKCRKFCFLKVGEDVRKNDAKKNNEEDADSHDAKGEFHELEPDKNNEQ